MSYYFVGLDLGQAQDFTALAIAELMGRVGPSQERGFHLRHLERFPLRTPYPGIAARTGALLGSDELRGRARLVVDATGVGAAVVDLLTQARLAPVPVTITAGESPTRGEGGGWRVPKRELVGVLQVLLQSERLRIASDLADAPLLQRELLNFQVKINPATAHDSYGAWREGTHDDLVLAVALACWYGDRIGGGEVRAIVAEPRTWSAAPGRALGDLL